MVSHSPWKRWFAGYLYPARADHLDGVLFVDYLSPLKRQRIRKKLEKTLV